MKFDFERFYQAVNAKRTQRAASWRQVAREIGIGKSTLARMAQNKRPDADGLAALSFWAQINPADFVLVEEPPPAQDRQPAADSVLIARSEEHTSELQSLRHLVCRLLLEKKKKKVR